MAGEKVFTTSASLLYVSLGGLTKVQFGFLSAGSWIFHLLGLLICWKISKKVSLKTMFHTGLFLFILSSILLLIAVVFNIESLVFLYIAILILMFATGFILCASAVGIVKPFPSLIALSTALAMGIEFLLSFVASFIVSHFSSKEILPVSFSIAILGILSLCIWFIFLKNELKKPS